MTTGTQPYTSRYPNLGTQAPTNGAYYELYQQSYDNQEKVRTFALKVINDLNDRGAGSSNRTSSGSASAPMFDLRGARLFNDERYIGDVNIGNTYHNRTKTEKDKDRENRTLIGILSLGVAAVGTYFCGRAYSDYQNATDLEAEASELGGRRLHVEHQFIDLSKEYYKGRLADAKINLALRTTLVAGAVIAFLGALTVTGPASIPVGIALGAVAGLGMLFKWGVGDKKLKNQGDRLLGAVNTALNQLQNQPAPAQQQYPQYQHQPPQNPYYQQEYPQYQ